MYLSRLILDTKSRTVRRDLSDCHQLHRTVLSAFPDLGKKDMDARQQFEVLHRIDLSRSGTPILLIQSAEMPDWSKLPTGYLLDDSSLENPACKSVDEQYGSIATGDIFTFRLRANPTKKVGTTGKFDLAAGKPKNNGTRVPLHGEEEQLRWLARKGTAGGFELLHVKVSSMLADPEAYKKHGPVPDTLANDEGICTISYHGTQKAGEGKVNDISLASVLYEGRLHVTDSELFMETLKKGIGSGKAYGFGLLSIARSA